MHSAHSVLIPYDGPAWTGAGTTGRSKAAPRLLARRLQRRPNSDKGVWSVVGITVADASASLMSQCLPASFQAADGSPSRETASPQSRSGFWSRFRPQNLGLTDTYHANLVVRMLERSWFAKLGG